MRIWTFRHASGCRVITLVCCLSIWFGCVGTKAPLQPEGSAARAPFRQVLIGLGEDYPKDSRSLAAARRDLELLQTNDIHLLRISFSWAEMEPEPDKLDWSFWDDFVRMATDEYGLRLVPYICYTPRWAAAKQTEDFWRQPPKDAQLFARFVSRIVERYRDRIHSWEIWNEPDNREYWLGSAEEFEALLQAGSQAVRRTDATATIVMGGLAWNLDFLNTLLGNASVITNVNAINLHNYYETWSGDALERLRDYVGRAHDLIGEHGQRQALWMAELGYSSFRSEAYVSRQSRAFYRYEHTPGHQAASLFRALSLLLASGKVSLVTWYRLHDLPETQEVIGDVNNRHLGLLDQKGQPKPALEALVYFRSLFRDGFRCIDGEVKVRKLLRSAAEAHVFQRPDGSVVVTAWLKTVVPGERGTNPVGQALDARHETIELAIPLKSANTAEVFDERGRRIGVCPVSVRAGQSRIPALELQGGGVTVVVLRRSDKRG